MERATFDDYEIGEVIGVGTVGTIYKVVDKKTRQTHALKLLSPAVSSNELIVNRFQREMLVLSKLDHPNIVAYHGNGRHNGQLFYVMEFVGGGTLKQLLLSGGPFSWRESAECGRRIAAALQHAHNHGIIHRDLKPGNVYLTVDGLIKLGDFGIARDLRSIELTDPGLTVGTYAYMAPELVRGEREISGQVDLYALGCLLFEMLTGRTPYVGDNFAEIFEKHLKSDPPHVRHLVPDCPEPLDGLIVRLLSKAPEDRPFNARTVQGILGELSDASMPSDVTHTDRAALDVHPIRDSMVQRIKRSKQTREVSWTTMALLSLCIVLLAIIFALLNGS